MEAAEFYKSLPLCQLQKPPIFGVFHPNYFFVERDAMFSHAVCRLFFGSPDKVRGKAAQIY